MKNILSFVCAVLLLLSFGIPAFAEETELNASVPGRHTVTIDSDGGRIAADGVVLDDAVEIERHKEQAYRVLPNPGKTLQALTYNGEDVTGEVKNGVFIAPKLVRDAALTAVYTDAPPAPDDKEYDIGGTVVNEDGSPLPGVTVDIGGQTDVTDEDGHFALEDVPSGTHPVAITGGNGQVIGSGEITVDKADKGDLTLTVDADGNPVVKPSEDTESIGLTFVVGKDGSIGVKDAKDTTPPPQLTCPQTGDDSNLFLWIALLFVSGTGLTGMVITSKKRKADR